MTVADRDSVAEVLAPNAVVDTFGRHSRWAFPLQTITELAALDEALDGALDALEKERTREGEHLREEMQQRLATMRELAVEVEKLAAGDASGRVSR